METSKFNKMMELYTDKIKRITEENPNIDEITLHTDKLNNDSEFSSILDSFFAKFLEKGKIDETELEKLSINDIAYNCYFCYLNKKNIQIIENTETFVPEEYISNDSVKEYLKNIGNVPLLTTEEELLLSKKIELSKKSKKNKNINQNLSNEEINELSKQIIIGNNIKERNFDQDDKSLIKQKIEDAEEAKKILFSNNNLTNKRMIQLAKNIYEGNKASQEFVNRNLRLVVSIAKRYVGKGLELLDLIQEGNIGLCRAIEKFDANKGFKFSTYATWWIRQGITRSIADQGRTIRIPVHMFEAINRLKRIEREYMVTHLGEEPSNLELAKALDISVSTVETIKKAMIYSDPVSLETPIGADEDSTLQEFVPDDSLPIEDTAIKNITVSDINKVLKTLTPREEKVIKLRFGINEEQKQYTLEEVGTIFKVTRERVRQIEAKALRKLRNPVRKKMLMSDEDQIRNTEISRSRFY